MNWCKDHPQYSAKREPKTTCGECWKLWFIRCPEERLMPKEYDIAWAKEALKAMADKS